MFRMVDHAELIAVRVAQDNEVGAVRIGPLIHARRPSFTQPLNITGLLAGVQVHVHPDWFLRRVTAGWLADIT
jgi:hypothetical protein